MGSSEVYNVIRVGEGGANSFEPMLAMHWVSRLFCMGHVKSTKPEDDEFVKNFSRSQKWLEVNYAWGT